VPPQGAQASRTDCIQIDTQPVCIICGGAFRGSSTDVVQRRLGAAIRSGFLPTDGRAATAKPRKEQQAAIVTAPHGAEGPGSLRLIPEFSARLPDQRGCLEPSMCAPSRAILNEPRDALVKAVPRTC